VERQWAGHNELTKSRDKNYLWQRFRPVKPRSKNRRGVGENDGEKNKEELEGAQTSSEKNKR